MESSIYDRGGEYLAARFGALLLDFRWWIVFLVVTPLISTASSCKQPVGWTAEGDKPRPLGNLHKLAQLRQNTQTAMLQIKMHHSMSQGAIAEPQGRNPTKILLPWKMKGCYVIWSKKKASAAEAGLK